MGKRKCIQNIELDPQLSLILKNGSFTLESMLSTKIFGKFYAGVKKFGRFSNEKYFSSFLNALTFLLQRKIFRKKIVDNIDP